MYDLTWIGRTPNTKTGDIPTAYVGSTVVEARTSCQGCPLLEKTCYAWNGFSALAMGRHEDRKAKEPARYSIDNAMATRSPTARAVRIGALGDPSRALRGVLMAAVATVRKAGLAVLSYTHFWRNVEADGLQGVCLASCEDIDEADQARARGFIPAVILPWDQYVECGPTFYLPSGKKGFVCPAQTKENVTCNTCRMCDPEHPVWKAGKAVAVGFLDHSKKARREEIRSQRGAQLPMFGRESRDTRPLGRA